MPVHRLSLAPSKTPAECRKSQRLVPEIIEKRPNQGSSKLQKLADPILRSNGLRHASCAACHHTIRIPILLSRFPHTRSTCIAERRAPQRIQARVASKVHAACAQILQSGKPLFPFEGVERKCCSDVLLSLLVLSAPIVAVRTPNYCDGASDPCE